MYLVPQELDTVIEVGVNITGPGEMVCSGSDGATTRVTFLLQHGLLSNMTADVGTLASTTSAPSVSVIAKGQVIFRGLPSPSGLCLHPERASGRAESECRRGESFKGFSGSVLQLLVPTGRRGLLRKRTDSAIILRASYKDGECVMSSKHRSTSCLPIVVHVLFVTHGLWYAERDLVLVFVE